MKGKCLSSYAVTATLRKNLSNTAKSITTTEDKQSKEEKKEEDHISIETSPKEEAKNEQKEEVKQEKKEEVQIPIEQK
ncbi:hypothetical protein KM1_240950 [Entamoeba histolytica HM-3:IMSS]|nr:hypothetical protein KM1_240950 [Entamoeba histolytica HM-3:IMSS]